METRHRRTATRLASQLGISQLYLVSNTDCFTQLSADEARYVFSDPDTIASTSAVCDLVFKKGALRYEWAGRGCCIVFTTPPIAMSDEEFVGVLIHELGHYVADGHKPWRDDDIHDRALTQFWANLQTESEIHGKRWLRAAVHLWSRACEFGYEVSLDRVVRLEQYGYKPADLKPLLPEANKRRAEPVEQILASPYPSPQTRQKEHRRPSATVTAEQEWRMLDDGSVAAADGRQFASIKAYYDDKQLRQLEIRRRVKARRHERRAEEMARAKALFPAWYAEQEEKRQVYGHA